MLDWLIIGGGIHGTHLAHVFVNQYGFSADAVRILDPHEQLLAAWTRRTENTGMRFLRSTRVHHIDIEYRSLEFFGQESNDSDPWIDPYHRPSYQLFQQHCQHVIDTYQLEHLHIRGQAMSLHRARKSWCVYTAIETLKSRHVVLAIGRQQPLIPDWADGLIKQNTPLQHVLDMTFDSQRIPTDGQIMVVGGGISAGQIALKLMNNHAVTLVTRQPLRQVDFDSSPCWLGPACMDAFEQANYQRRRWMIGEARQPGTLAQDVYKDMHTTIQSGQVRHLHSKISTAVMTDDNRIRLMLTDGSVSTVDHVVLATGLQAVPPGQTWLADTIRRYNFLL